MPACSGCGADIVWGITKSGARMPVDPEPVNGGNLVKTHADPLMVKVVRPEPDVMRYVSHYVTCPYAARFRKSAGVKGKVEV